MAEVIDFKRYKEESYLPPKTDKIYGVIIQGYTPETMKHFVVCELPDGQVVTRQLAGHSKDFVDHFVHQTDGDDPFIIFLDSCPYVEVQELEE